VLAHEHMGFSRVPSDVSVTDGPLVGAGVVNESPSSTLGRHLAVTGVSSPYDPYSTVPVLVM
jgi:hypothetical protein